MGVNASWESEDIMGFNGKHLSLEDRKIIENNINICTSKCKDFEEIPCLRRDRFIGSCNNCPEIKKCKKAKYFYYANVTQQNYEYTLKDSREGVNLNTRELFDPAHIICPLIKQGQSIYTI